LWRRSKFKHFNTALLSIVPILLQKLNGFPRCCQIWLCNEGLLPKIRVDRRRRDAGLGYLRHGSLGWAARDGPADRGAWRWMRWRGLAGLGPGDGPSRLSVA
jgi:hypothetical protein